MDAGKDAPSPEISETVGAPAAAALPAHKARPRIEASVYLFMVSKGQNDVKLLMVQKRLRLMLKVQTGRMMPGLQGKRNLVWVICTSSMQ